MMKVIKNICIIIILFVCSLLVFTACGDDKGAKSELAAPTNLHVGERDVLLWDKVDGADRYEVNIDGEVYNTDEERFDMFDIILDTDEHFIKVCALSDDKRVSSSDYSAALSYALEPSKGCFLLGELSDGNGFVVKANGKLPEKLIVPDIIDDKQIIGIPYRGFYGDENVKIIILPDSIESIDSEAFANCTSLEKIVLSQRVEHIDMKDFDFCTSLKQLHIPKGVKSISGFAHGLSLESLTVDEENETYYSKDDCILKRNDDALYYACGKSVVPAFVTRYEECAFAGCENLFDLEMSDTVTEIGAKCFEYCTNLKSIKLSASLESLPDLCFEECSSLEAVQLPQKVKSVGKQCFYICTSLKSVKLSAAFESFGKQAFAWCHSLEDLTIDENNPKYYVENDCLIERETKTVVQGTRTSVIPENVSTIGSYAFCDLDLRSVTIPSNIKNIGDHAFFMNNDLRYLELAEGIESIGSYAFMQCFDLKYVALPKSLKEIGNNAFSFCFCMIAIPKEIEINEFEFGAFNTCEIYTDRSKENPITFKESTAMDSGNAAFIIYECQFENEGGSYYLDSSFLNDLYNIIPYRHGYVFKGWSTVPGGESEFDFYEFECVVWYIECRGSVKVGSQEFLYDVVIGCGGAYGYSDHGEGLKIMKQYRGVRFYALWERE